MWFKLTRNCILCWEFCYSVLQSTILVLFYPSPQVFTTVLKRKALLISCLASLGTETEYQGLLSCSWRLGQLDFFVNCTLFIGSPFQLYPVEPPRRPPWWSWVVCELYKKQKLAKYNLEIRLNELVFFPCHLKVRLYVTLECSLCVNFLTLIYLSG